MSGPFLPQDDRFDQPGWATMPAAAPFAQRHLKGQKRIFCETIMTVPGRRDAAVALIRGPWTWWDRGRVKDFHEHDDGSTEQILSPVWWFMTRVGLHILPPTTLGATPDGVRLAIHLSRHFVGPATIDVIDAAGGRLVIRGRFHGVENHVPLAPVWLADSLHLRAEAGTMLFPFPRGTGWRGLARALDADAAR